MCDAKSGGEARGGVRGGKRSVAAAGGPKGVHRRRAAPSSRAAYSAITAPKECPVTMMDAVAGKRESAVRIWSRTLAYAKKKKPCATQAVLGGHKAPVLGSTSARSKSSNHSKSVTVPRKESTMLEVLAS